MPYHRSEEHTSELQSHDNLVCRLLLEKKKKKNNEQKSYDIYHRAGTLATLIHAVTSRLALIVTRTTVSACVLALSFLFFFFLMIRRPPRSTLFPTRRSSD